MLKLSIIYGILYITNDRNEAANWRIIQKNNGMRKRRFSWKSVLTALRNMDCTGRVSGHWQSIVNVPRICCIPISIISMR